MPDRTRSSRRYTRGSACMSGTRSGTPVSITTQLSPWPRGIVRPRKFARMPVAPTMVRWWGSRSSSRATVQESNPTSTCSASRTWSTRAGRWRRAVNSRARRARKASALSDSSGNMTSALIDYTIWCLWANSCSARIVALGSRESPHPVPARAGRPTSTVQYAHNPFSPAPSGEPGLRSRNDAPRGPGYGGARGQPMDIVDALVGEHGVLGAECEDLEGLVALASSLAEVRAQTALLASGLQSHAQVEDELLFTALEPSLGASSPVLQGMRMMHEDIDRGLARAVQARDLAEIRDALLGVLDLTRQHFMGEEQVVFPLARDTLPLAIREHLGSQWADRRGIFRLAIGSLAPEVLPDGQRQGVPGQGED